MMPAASSSLPSPRLHRRRPFIDCRRWQPDGRDVTNRSPSHELIDLFGKMLEELGLPATPDPRVEGYPLMGSFWPTAGITLAYVVGVWLWREHLNRKRNLSRKSTTNGYTVPKAAQPAQRYDLVKILMIIYNIAMVIYSGFLVIETLIMISRAGYTLGCVPLDRGTGELSIRLVNIGYLFYFSKFIEMLDTVFFLWRGKLDQVTFLHVFHHAAMPPSIWWGVKYAPGGIVFMFPLANSFVHVIMYTYYGLAAMGAYRFLWWKKYLTVLQMVQFVIFLLHQSQVFTYNRDCDYPKVFPAAICFYAAVFLVLFGNFYVKAYWKRERLSKADWDAAAKKTSSVTTNGHVSNGVLKHHQNGVVNSAAATSHSKDSKKAV
ncbi:unnamed protein product [Schistocephalus solidus]|uniref:Elongation of very long chain fatty acids protein n=1 Tax=Schistocephalus solidus TaxID=70667 RepID=A0A183T828_SCHSO|nr:unnamed protein product [Schistocephalus solidus]